MNIKHAIISDVVLQASGCESLNSPLLFLRLFITYYSRILVNYKTQCIIFVSAFFNALTHDWALRGLVVGSSSGLYETKLNV